MNRPVFEDQADGEAVPVFENPGVPAHRFAVQTPQLAIQGETRCQFAGLDNQSRVGQQRAHHLADTGQFRVEHVQRGKFVGTEQPRVERPDVLGNPARML